MSDGLSPRSDARLTRALWAARAAMLWEQGGKIWTPWLIAAGAVAAAALWGLTESGGEGVRLILLAVAGLIALALSVRGAMTIRWPSRAAVRARLEADSDFEHTPLTALEDAPAVGDAGLWALHRASAEQAIAKARVRPRAGLAAADPLALRWALVVAAALALWARGPERVDHVAAAFAPPADPATSYAAVRTTVLTAAGQVRGWFTPGGDEHAEAKGQARAE